MPDNLDPWTSRESTKLRGLPIQKDPAYCFQNQLLDVRFGQARKFYGLPSSRDPLENEFTDVIQSWRGRRCVHMLPKWGPKAVDLAGNGMIMGDLATACYSMWRCAKTSLMEFLFGAPARAQNSLC